MIVSIAINPATLGPMGVVDSESCQGARDVIQAAKKNAVLLAFSNEKFLSELSTSVLQLGTLLGQHPQVDMAELLKNHRPQCVALPLAGRASMDGPERLIALARDYRADLIVCANKDEMEAVKRGFKDCECCLLPDFDQTATEQLRREWEQAVDLTPLDTNECLNVVGRIVKFTSTVVLADKMIVRPASSGDKGMVRRFMKGVAFVAKAWSLVSPLATSGNYLEVEIVTDAFGCKDFDSLRDIIQIGIDATDVDSCVGPVEVRFKKDSHPSVFKGRYLGAGRRGWIVEHGLDDIGRLFDGVRSRSTTILGSGPPYGYALSKIQRLPDAD